MVILMCGELVGHFDFRDPIGHFDLGYPIDQFGLERSIARLASGDILGHFDLGALFCPCVFF